MDLLDFTLNSTMATLRNHARQLHNVLGEAFTYACDCVIEQLELATSRKRRVTASEVRVEIEQGLQPAASSHNLAFYSSLIINWFVLRSVIE